ncbi:hypothetical protein ABZZ17_30065 [Streptomyces sp. NPDC006512]|uniref:hypothetical protein n=1 Tax=Streptomyces sp. NPDC006512 TaxID=3154307 RepID=UPI0033ACB2FD
MIVNRAARALATRWARTRFDPAAFGLLPRERLDPLTAGPEGDPARAAERGRVAAAAHAGEWRPAAAHVRAAGTDWDERWTRLELLIRLSGADDRWLTDWRAAEPADGDAATVHAHLLVSRAWAVRGSAVAREVPDADMSRFMAQLPAAVAAAQRRRPGPRGPGPLGRHDHGRAGPVVLAQPVR